MKNKEDTLFITFMIGIIGIIIIILSIIINLLGDII